MTPTDTASMARELLNRRTATPQSGGVVVKGLEWAKNGPASLWTGELIFGVYYVADEEGDRWRVVRGQFLSEAGMTEIAFGSLDTVKAAAQADYEAHIRSTLADPIPEAPADEEVEAELRRQADAAYIRYINLMGTKPCLGVEAKLASGEFGAANLDAHREASEALGRHRGINAAIDILRAIRRSTETDKPGVREAGWRPIETAPKDGVDVILGTGPQMYQGRSVPARVTVGHWTTEEECRIDIGDCGGDCLCREYEYADPSWISWDGGFTEENPATHWMPLPEAPDRALSVSPLTEEQPAEGWKLVPVEPTEAMIASAVASYHLPPGDVAVATEHVAKVFRAMLAAAPLPRSTTGGAK